MCQFIRNNSTNNFGGAIFADQASQISIYDSNFVLNTGYHGGGAISADQNSTVLIVLGCNFRGNNSTKGINDISRSDDTSVVTFACYSIHDGPHVEMVGPELLNPNPAALLQCYGNFLCQTPRATHSPRCVANPLGDYSSFETGGASPKTCGRPGLCSLSDKLSCI